MEAKGGGGFSWGSYNGMMKVGEGAGEWTRRGGSGTGSGRGRVYVSVTPPGTTNPSRSERGPSTRPGLPPVATISVCPVGGRTSVYFDTWIPCFLLLLTGDLVSGGVSWTRAG